MNYGKKVVSLLALGILFVFLVAAEDACLDDVEEQASAPAEEAAPEPGVSDEELTAIEAELAYLSIGGDLLDRTLGIMDLFGDWSEDTAALYGQEVMYPPTDVADEALIEAKAITEQVRALSVPPGYEESHAYWLAAQEELEMAFTLAIAGVEGFDVNQIVEGTARLTESTRLIDLATDAIPK